MDARHNSIDWNTFPKDSEAQLNFINSLSDEDLVFWAGNNENFCKIFSLIKDAAVEKTLLERLEKNKQSLQINFKPEIFNVIRQSNIAYLIENILAEKIGNEIKESYALYSFVRSFYDSSIKSIILTSISCLPSVTCFKDLYDFRELLEKVSTKQRLNLSKKMVEKKCLDWRNDFYFTDILKLLELTERLELLAAIAQADPEVLPKFHKKKLLWKEIKFLLPLERNLDGYIYSAEELAAKAILRNIKTTINNISDSKTKEGYWSFGMFNSASSYSSWHPRSNKLTRDHLHRVVPIGVAKQLEQLEKTSERKQSHAAALQEIKKIGRANVTTAFFVTKGVTEKYFDTFSTEQVFDQTYGSKKPSA